MLILGPHAGVVRSRGKKSVNVLGVNAYAPPSYVYGTIRTVIKNV
jgi:hypothetical protein